MVAHDIFFSYVFYYPQYDLCLLTTDLQLWNIFSF